MKTNPLISLSIICVTAVHALASPQLQFSEVWTQVKNSSKAIKAAGYEYDSAQSTADRLSWHWLPKLSISEQSLYSNDPGAILFSKIGERNITGADFSPLALNFPDYAQHDKLSVNAKMMLYEGGFSFYQANTYEKIAASKKFEEKANLVAEYSASFSMYGKLISLANQELAIDSLREIIDNTIQKYAVGQASNPLGHSGLLGLKNIKNRLIGEQEMVQTQKRTIYLIFKTKYEIEKEWEPSEKNIPNFIATHVEPYKKTEDSFSVTAAKLASESLQYAAKAERSKYLPQIGVFADQSYYRQSDITVANSRTAGVIVRWDLLDMTNFGITESASKKALAMEYQAQVKSLEQKTAFIANQDAAKTLNLEIQLSEESLKLLEEQTLIARKLFNNGLINVLQLVEIYSRRLDVVDNKAKLEDQLLKIKAESMNYQPWENL